MAAAQVRGGGQGSMWMKAAGRLLAILFCGGRPRCCIFAAPAAAFYPKKIEVFFMIGQIWRGFFGPKCALC